MKPIASFLKIIGEKEVQAKDINPEDDNIYIKKQDAVEAYMKREREIKKTVSIFFPRDSRIMKELGFIEQEDDAL